jgi:chaperonin GroEL
MQFDRGYLSPYFITNADKMVCELDESLHSASSKKNSPNLQSMLPVLEAVVQSGKSAADYRRRRRRRSARDPRGQQTAWWPESCCREGPRLRRPPQGDAGRHGDPDRRPGDLRRPRHQAGERHAEHAGPAKKVRITKDDTIIDGKAAKKDIEARVAQIKAQIEETSSDYDKEKLQERLAKLAGGVAVIRVGGATEVEVKERKDRVDDAMHATRAAVEEGVVAGGGSALLYATKALASLKGDNADQQVGIDIVRKAIQAPIRQIAENAGKEGSIVVGKLMDQKDTNFGYNAQNDNYCRHGQGRHHRPRESRSYRAAGCRIRRWPSDHDRSDDRRCAGR